MNRFLQSVIALSGLFITGLLGWLTVETQDRAAESARAQAQLQFLQMYTSLTTAAIKDCDATLLPYVQNAIDILPTRTELERQDRLKFEMFYQRTLNAVEACTARAGGEPPAVNRVVQNVDLQASESVPLRNGWARSGSYDQVASSYRAAVTEGAWHAVLASYVVGKEEPHVIDDVQKLRAVLPAAGDPTLAIEVYRTKTTGHYAIVVSGPEKTRDAANELVGTARRLNWAGDAFATLDREWTRCEPPDTLDGLKACGAAGVRR